MVQQFSNTALDVAMDAARAAGRLLLRMFNSTEVREKSRKDLVTDADVAAQQVIRDRLMQWNPGLAWVGEEDKQPQVPSDGQACWVVDPLDGTANYVHGLPSFAVSIALVKNQASQLGVVYDPMAAEMFWAVLGHGAFRNGQPLRCSNCMALDQAMVAASFPPNVTATSFSATQFMRVLGECRSIRRLGSAALNLCYVGCGRLDGYWASSVRSWDVAAGSLIAREAGAHLTNLRGQGFRVWEGDLVVASTPCLHQRLMECLSSDG